jgi:hypothetical protein
MLSWFDLDGAMTGINPQAPFHDGLDDMKIDYPDIDGTKETRERPNRPESQHPSKFFRLAKKLTPAAGTGLELHPSGW